jgi:putative flippase GtrA
MVRELYFRYRLLIHEGAKFGVVGAIGFVVTDGGTNLLRAHPGMDWLEANAIATVVAIAVTFLGSRYWTFRHRERTGMGRETVLFFLLAGIGLLIQLACLGFTTHVLGETDKLPANTALILGIALATLFRFWSYRKWVWTAPQEPPAVAALGGQEVPDPAAPGSSAPGQAGGSLQDEVGRSR